MVTLKKVIEAIENSGFSIWDLYQVKGYNSTQKIGFFDSSAVEKEEDKIGAAISHLQKTVEGWPLNTSFHITIKNATRSNGDKILNFDFIQESQANQNLSGLGSVDNQVMQRNYEEELQGLEKRLSDSHKLEVQKLLFEQDKKNFEEYKVAEQKKLDERKKEIDSASYKFGKGFGFAIEKVAKIPEIKEFFGLSSIEGIPKGGGEKEEQPDERQERITDIGTDLYEDKDLTAEDLGKLRPIVKTFVNKLKESRNGIHQEKNNGSSGTEQGQ